MATTLYVEGSETVSVTEWSLTTDSAGPDVDTTDGLFQCFLDLSALASADEYVFKVYEKVQSASTQRLIYSSNINWLNHAPIFVSPPFLLLYGWDMTLDRVSGADAAITWSIRRQSPTITVTEVSETVGGTEWSFVTDSAGPDTATDDLIGQCFLDLNALTGTDEFSVKIYEKVQVADTQRVVWQKSLIGPQNPPVLVFPCLDFMNGWDLTVDKIAGTDRAIDGSIRKVA